MASPADLATLRLCEQAECDFTVINGITDLKDILMVMANHIASMHPASAPSNVKECWGLGRSLMEQSSFNMASPADLATLRICDSENCEFKVLASTSASNTPAVAALISGQQGQSQDTATATSQDTELAQYFRLLSKMVEVEETLAEELFRIPRQSAGGSENQWFESTYQPAVRVYAS